MRASHHASGRPETRFRDPMHGADDCALRRRQRWQQQQWRQTQRATVALCLGLLLLLMPILVVAAPEKQSQQQGGGLRRRAQQAPEAAIEGLEDPFYGKATDLEGQPRSFDEEGSGVAAALGGAMLASGFGLDWAGVARDMSNMEEVEIEASADKSLLSRASETLTANSHWPFCAWDATTDASIYTPLLLDPNAVYQPQLLEFGPEGTVNRVYRFKAAFPTAVYMSYQSYTLNGAPLTSIFDRQLLPAWGLNPYRTVNATPATAGGYEVYVTRDGKQGWPNELKGLPAAGERTGGTRMPSALKDMAIVILRFYNTQPPPLVWGGGEAPELAYSDDFGATWKVLAQCSDNERQRFNTFLMRSGRTMHDLQGLVNSNERLRDLSCDMVVRPEANAPAFFPSVNPQTSNRDQQGFIPFSNYDSNYAYWCTDAQQLGSDFVMVVTGELPTVCSGLYEPPRPAADVESYAVRYWGLQSSELNWPRPSYASISGVMMEEFYGAGWNREYRVVAAVSRDSVRACGLDSEQSMFLPFANPAANVTSPPVFPTIIAREQLSRASALGRSSQDTDSIGYVVKNCGSMHRCRDPKVLQEFLGKKAPELKVYKCDVKTGVATPFVYQPTAADLEMRAQKGYSSSSP